MSRDHWHALREMVEQWAHVASQVDHGYPLTFDDYLNDLDLRWLIDERVQQVEEAPGAAMPESIAVSLVAADERFRSATTNSEANVWGSANERENGWSAERQWYYYRLPKVLPDQW